MFWGPSNSEGTLLLGRSELSELLGVLILQGTAPCRHKQNSGAVEEQSRVCCCHSRGRGSMETPERASLPAGSKQQHHRQHQGTYQARWEARIISIHLAKCFQSPFQSRLKENRASIEQTKLICTYSTLLKKKLKLSDCYLLLVCYFPLRENAFFFLFFLLFLFVCLKDCCCVMVSCSYTASLTQKAQVKIMG